jgi:hypothetical protein
MRIRPLRAYLTERSFLLQNLRFGASYGPQMAIFSGLRHLCRSGRRSQWPARSEFRGFVLNAPLSSVICR